MHLSDRGAMIADTCAGHHWAHTLSAHWVGLGANVQHGRLGPGPSADAGPPPGFDATPPTHQTQPRLARSAAAASDRTILSIELLSGAELLSADQAAPGGFRVVQGGGLDDLQRERAALLSLPGDRGAEHGLDHVGAILLREPRLIFAICTTRRRGTFAPLPPARHGFAIAAVRARTSCALWIDAGGLARERLEAIARAPSSCPSRPRP